MSSRFSAEHRHHFRVPILYCQGEGHIGRTVTGKVRTNTAESKTLFTRGHSKRENREVQLVSTDPLSTDTQHWSIGLSLRPRSCDGPGLQAESHEHHETGLFDVLLLLLMLDPVLCSREASLFASCGERRGISGTVSAASDRWADATPLAGSSLVSSSNSFVARRQPSDVRTPAVTRRAAARQTQECIKRASSICLID